MKKLITSLALALVTTLVLVAVFGQRVADLLMTSPTIQHGAPLIRSILFALSLGQ